MAALRANGLRALGLSHAKAVAVADLHLAGTLDTDHLDRLDDQHVLDAPISVRGIGPWTARMFLIHQLRRPDVLPAGDLGLRHTAQAAWSWPELPAVALLWISLRPGPAAT